MDKHPEAYRATMPCGRRAPAWFLGAATRSGAHHATVIVKNNFFIKKPFQIGVFSRAGRNSHRPGNPRLPDRRCRKPSRRSAEKRAPRHVVHVNGNAQHGGERDQIRANVAIADGAMVCAPGVHHGIDVAEHALARQLRRKPMDGQLGFVRSSSTE